jgi:hypothetical protein
MPRTAWSLALFLLTVACGGLSPEERAAVAKLAVVSADPGVGCQNLGPVSGNLDTLRLKALKLGADTVQVDSGQTSGTAFFCSKGEARKTLPPIIHP